MAVSTPLAFLTILLFFFLAGAAVANSDYDKIHAVKRCSPDSGKGEQCTEENGDADDDFDDTYKIVDNVAVSLSPSGRMLQQTATSPSQSPSPSIETTTLTVVEKAMEKEKETAKEAEKETEKEDFDPEDNPAAEEVAGNLFVLGH